MSGVGTQLHKIFRWWGFQATDKCQCDARRRHYDQMGPIWCREHIDEIADEILEEAGNRKQDFTANLRTLLPALSLSMPRSVQRIVLKRIVQVCINRALAKK